MTRTALPALDQIPAVSNPALDSFTENIGFTPNVIGIFTQNPIVFNAWATLFASLSKSLDMKTHDSTGLAVSEVNGCDDCPMVHSFDAELPAEEFTLPREGLSAEPKREAAIRFARRVIETRGKVSDAELKAVRAAGYTDVDVMEIIAVSLLFFTTNEDQRNFRS